MKDEIETIRDTVLKVAKEKPYCRDSYWRLYFEVLLEMDICKTSKNSVYFIHFKNLEFMVNPESVSRAYRKLKEEFPEIRPSANVQEFRNENEREMEGINLWWQPNHIIGVNKCMKDQTTLLGDE